MAVTNPYENPPEEEEQIALVQWLRLHKIAFAHTPNEGKHKVQYRAKQARLGVQPGVPDLLIFDRPPYYPERVGAAIELKRRKGGRVSDAQVEWLDKLSDRGWAVAVCNGATEAIECLESLGYGRVKGVKQQL